MHASWYFFQSISGFLFPHTAGIIANSRFPQKLRILEKSGSHMEFKWNEVEGNVAMS